MTSWTACFVVAAVLTALVTPVVRRLALRIGFVSPAVDRHGELRSMPYLGGVAVAVAVSVAALIGPVAGRRTLLLLGGAAVLLLVGLVDDRKPISPRIRLVTEVGMAVAAYAAGIRVSATGIEPLDALITVVWIAGVTNAFNLMDNMDGLSSIAAVGVSAPIFVLAAMGGQDRVATLAIALTGASIGFVAHNFRPATIFMGDAGALYIGFLAATLSLQVDPTIAPPASFLVPLLLVAVPVLDTTTVTLGRLRHGRSPLVGGKDHLSHRLVSRGMSREAAVLLLGGAQLVLGALGVLAGRRVLPPAITLAVAAVLVVLVAVAAVPGKVYPARATGLPRAVKMAALVGIGAAVAASIPAMVGLLQARRPMLQAASQARSALAAARAGDVERANTLFARAESGFADAESRLSGPARSLGLGVPVLSSNLRAGRALSRTGRELSATGAHLATSANFDELKVDGGRIDLAVLAGLVPQLDRASTALEHSRSTARTLRYPYLVPEVERAVVELRDELDGTARDAANAAAAGRVLLTLLGGEGERRYFIAMQNSAEARATGGFIGNFGELVARDGALRVERFGRISELNNAATANAGAGPTPLDAPPDYVGRYGRFEVATTWQNVNLSPDLSTVAQVIGGLYPKSGGRELDGLIAVDSLGLTALLKLTGPVAVPAWPEPLTAANAVDVTLARAYEAFPDQERRVSFLDDVAHAIVNAATTVDLGAPTKIVRTLGPAVREGHLQVVSLHDDENAVLRRLGLHQALSAPRGDSLLLTTQNSAGNKVDLYLRRSVQHRLHIDPVGDGRTANVTGTTRIGLDNQAPDHGLPEQVIGPYDSRFAPGENRSFVSVYSPLGLSAARLDGEPASLEVASELGHSVYSAFVSIPAGGNRTLELDLRGSLRAGSDGWYRLELLRQPSIAADRVEVVVEAPAGWHITGTRGLRRTSPQRAIAELAMTSAGEFAVRLEPLPPSVLSRLLHP